MYILQIIVAVVIIIFLYKVSQLITDAKVLLKKKKDQMSLYNNSDVFLCTGLWFGIEGQVMVFGDLIKSELRSGDVLEVNSEEKIIKDIYGGGEFADAIGEKASPGEATFTFVGEKEDPFFMKLHEGIEKSGFVVMKIIRK